MKKQASLFLVLMILFSEGEVRTTRQDDNNIYIGGTFNWVDWWVQHITRFIHGATKPGYTFSQLGGSTVYDIEPDGSGCYVPISLSA